MLWAGLLLKTGEELLNRVNSAYIDMKMVEKSIARQAELLKRTRDMIQDLSTSKLFSADEYAVINSELMGLMESGAQIIKMFDLIIQEGKTKMNDAERLEAIFKIDEKLKDNQRAVNEKMQHYQEVKEEREMIYALKLMNNELNKDVKYKAH